MAIGMCDTPTTKRAKCPQCQLEFTYDPAKEPGGFPFCGSRCQWIDLGKWMQGDFRISKSLLADDDEQED